MSKIMIHNYDKNFTKKHSNEIMNYETRGHGREELIRKSLDIVPKIVSIHRNCLRYQQGMSTNTTS